MEGLYQVVVRSPFQALHAVLHLPPGGKHKDGKAPPLPKAPEEGEAVHAGEHHVQDGKIVREGLQEPQGLLGAFRPVHGVPLGLEGLLHQLPHPGVILHQKEPHPLSPE